MARAGAVRVLTDGHHHQVYRGKPEIIAFLETLLSEQEQFQAVLRQILEEHDGLTVEQIYACVRECQGDPAVSTTCPWSLPTRRSPCRISSL
jgi:hypothetical protein